MTIKDNPKVNWSDKILSECIGEEPPPCQAACPLNIRVREKLRLMQQGDLAGALALVLELLLPRHPGPHLHPSLRGGLHPKFFGPAHRHRWAETLPGGPWPPDVGLNVAPGPDRPQRVAVVGGGPAGSWRLTSCAASAIRSPSSKPNLSWAEPCGSTSPPTACPGRFWSGRSAWLRSWGWKLSSAPALAEMSTWKTCAWDFAAVFLALGAHKGLSLQIPGENLPGVMGRHQLLKGRQRGDTPGSGPPGGRHRRRQRRGGRGPLRLAGRGPGSARSIAVPWTSCRPWPRRWKRPAGKGFSSIFSLCRCACWETTGSGDWWPETGLGDPDADGRSCPMPAGGSEFTLEVDLVIPAVGQTADFSFFGPGLAFDTATIFRLEADPVSLAVR